MFILKVQLGELWNTEHSLELRKQSLKTEKRTAVLHYSKLTDDHCLHNLMLILYVLGVLFHKTEEKLRVPFDRIITY